MAKALLNMLTREEQELIHGQSIACLEEMGVLVRSDSVLKILEDHGAEVDRDRQVARISEGMVSEAIAKAPKEITLCGREPRHDMRLPVPDIPYAATTGLATYMTDLETGERRNATRADLADFAKLSDALEGVDFFWTMVVPMDVPPNTHTIHQLWTSLQNTTKHVQQIEVMNAEDAKAQIQLASVVAGGEDELRKRPLFSVVSSPVSPLSFEKGTVESQVELSRAGIPVASTTMPLSGLTCPVTVAGTINLINAENLASLVISQSAAESSPFIYSSSAVPGDMKTGEADFNAVEVPFITTGLGQMAKRYGLPAMIGDWGLCAGKKPGVDKAFSEVSSTALDTFSGADLICGFGSIDDAKGCSLEQVVIDSYTWENWRLFLRSVTVDEASIALDVLREVGHGGTFISHMHTVRNFRESLVRRDPDKTRWEATLSDSMVPEARAVAKKILSEHEPVRIDRALVDQGDAIVRGYERSVTG